MSNHVFRYWNLILYTGLFFEYSVSDNDLPWIRHKPEPVDADHVLYPAILQKYGERDPYKRGKFEHEGYYPRTYYHSIFKYGYCPPAMLKRSFLSRRANITLIDVKSSDANYIYLIEANASIRFRVQCVVMKILVPRRYLFLRGRYPIYYCQGTLRYVYLMTYQKLDIHEFYLYQRIAMPSYIEFEFYHAPPIVQYS